MFFGHFPKIFLCHCRKMVRKVVRKVVRKLAMFYGIPYNEKEVIYLLKETETIELKREVSTTICKEIIAFANTNGGTIYVGYDDNGNLVGVKNAKEDLDKISNMIADSIEPNLTFNVSMEIVEDSKKSILVIKVLKGTNRPYYLKSKGMTSSGVYIRLGTTSRPATREEILRMMMEDTGVKFEDNISIYQDLTFQSLKKEFEEKEIHLDSTKMKNLGIRNNANQYTNLALIISDQNPYPIKIAVYKGNDKVEFLDQKELDHMSVFEQLHEIERFLKLFIKVPAKIVGMKRVESPEYDFEVIRESLLNSIIHRDYSVESSTLINIYEDTIEIANIGGLIGGLTVAAIKRGSSATRNPKLASIFHRLNYIEAYGSGIPRIFAKYKNQKEKPMIETTENSFFIRFPKLKNNDSGTTEWDVLVQYMDRNPKLYREDAERLWGCSKTTAIRRLKNYVENGQLNKVINGKGTYYTLK